MNITIIGRKCAPRDSFKERVEKKMAKIGKFFGEDADAKVTATVEKGYKNVEITVYKNGMIFRAEERGDELNDAFDRSFEALIRQLRKNKTKLEKKFRSVSFEDIAHEEPVTEEIEYEVVRSKKVALKPQHIDEAILQMNMLGHQFFLFLNAETDRVNVVYKRNDGGYGVLEPEKE